MTLTKRDVKLIWDMISSVNAPFAAWEDVAEVKKKLRAILEIPNGTDVAAKSAPSGDKPSSKKVRP